MRSPPCCSERLFDTPRVLFAVRLPNPLLSLKLCLQDLFDYFVDSFDLSVGLGVIHDCETLPDPQRFAKLDELLAGKLGPVVCNYLPRNSESANNIIACEVLYL